MNGFVETRNGVERPLSISRIGTLTPETHPELLAHVSSSLSKAPSRGPSIETQDIDDSYEDPLPFASVSPSPSIAESSSPEEPSSRPSSPESASPPYKILITEAAICDKSKTNALAKLITVSQTTWFIVQFVGRWVAHQPRTHLELMTVAYALLNAIVYALWWNKPYNIDVPINVSNRGHESLRSRTIGIRDWPSVIQDALDTASGGDTPLGQDVGTTMFMFSGTLFGGLHCFAWHFHFPTEQEAILWRGGMG